RRCGRTELEPVDEARLGRRGQGVQHRAEAGEVRAVQAVPVDLARRDNADDHLLRTSDHGTEELLALRGRALLRVVQERERPDAVVAQTLVVEQHARDDERPRERPATRLVRAGDEPRTELPVELEEPLPGPASHGREHSAGLGRYTGGAGSYWI